MARSLRRRPRGARPAPEGVDAVDRDQLVRNRANPHPQSHSEVGDGRDEIERELGAERAQIDRPVAPVGGGGPGKAQDERGPHRVPALRHAEDGPARMDPAGQVVGTLAATDAIATSLVGAPPIRQAGLAPAASSRESGGLAECAARSCSGRQQKRDVAQRDACDA